MRLVLIAMVVARTVLADAPHGRYSLGVTDKPDISLYDADGKSLPSCGARTKSVRDRLRTFRVSFRPSRNPQATDEVFVDDEPWRFQGHDTDRRATASKQPSGRVLVVLNFGVDRHGDAQGSVDVYVVESNGGKMACGDARPLTGSYSRPAP